MEGTRRKTPAMTTEVLKVRLDHMEGQLTEVKHEVHELKNKVDKNHSDLVERFERTDNRAIGQLIAVILTLVTAVGTLILKLLHP